MESMLVLGEIPAALEVRQALKTEVAESHLLCRQFKKDCLLKFMHW